MKKSLLGAVLLASLIVVPTVTTAQVSVSVNVGLPPPVVFEAPPHVVVLPETNGVYVVPGIDIDLFFWNGWWWRPWEGRWYRSRYYDRGWVHYDRVPSFYYDVDPGWRSHYRNGDWYGHRWNYEPIPNKGLQKNWKSWQQNQYWERHNTWGVQGYQPRSQQQRQELRYQRQQQYEHRPEGEHPQHMQPQGRPGGGPGEHGGHGGGHGGHGD